MSCASALLGAPGSSPAPEATLERSDTRNSPGDMAVDVQTLRLWCPPFLAQLSSVVKCFSRGALLGLTMLEETHRKAYSPLYSVWNTSAQGQQGGKDAESHQQPHDADGHHRVLSPAPLVHRKPPRPLLQSGAGRFVISRAVHGRGRLYHQRPGGGRPRHRDRWR